MSQTYSTKIAAIPLPPPPPPPPVYTCPPPLEERGLSQQHRRSPSPASADEYDTPEITFPDSIDVSNGARDAAQELEDTVLGVPAVRGALKRTASSAVSNSGSDRDSPPARAPAGKRRRVDAAASSEIGITLDNADIALSTTKGKGKHSAILDGALTPAGESMSVSTKGRKKGPRKKLDNIQAQDTLGVSISSHDGTPSASRAPSPAPSVSSAVYELGDAIPPLKKARKVDDATMAKRIRNLEEAQRKVWTNIARRDVAKVRTTIPLSINTKLTHSSTGVQIPTPRFPSTTGTKQAYGDACVDVST
jgi:chromatin-remodeling ATPase INO80